MLGICVCLFFGCKTVPEPTLGVWWWNDELGEEYLTFAQTNNVNEIYFCSSKMDNQTAEFIQNAKIKNIKVYLLAGEYQWLEDSTDLYTLIDRYNQYQSLNPNSQFDGIHLDIEPHQHQNFDQNRQTLILNLIQLAYNLKTDFPKITFDYDIPFWLNDEVEFNNKTQPAYKHMIDIANRVFVMSYRDTAEKIYDVAKEEIEYATSLNKSLVLGVETLSSEGDNVSFMEEGKEYMNGEISKLRELIPSYMGVCIHQIKTWHDLPN